jgi:hypothetical protein
MSEYAEIFVREKDPKEQKMIRAGLDGNYNEFCRKGKAKARYGFKAYPAPFCVRLTDEKVK